MIAVFVLVATIIAFTVYFIKHPEIITTLQAVSLLTITKLFVLYCVFIATLVWIQRATLSLCELTLGRKESALLVMYSSIINFFGPLQSGPGFRAAYLKKKHNVSLKKYTLATLVYYGLYALFSGLLLLSFFVGWWIGAVCILALAATPIMLRLKKFKSLKLRGVLSLALATLAQVVVLTVIYFVELYSLLPQVSYLQSLAYTGAANFALFVSLTPGAIGFRESFLLFSQKLHDIGVDTIAAASVIDRSIYIVFLLIMAAGIFGLHANDYFKTNRTESDKQESKA
ncbi:MAG: hypothetical protein JWP13_134 [Candidatus Saccharibacteria bacterium]|nr:hypothetical protein [Candidatus Saccharibacteria bacterium]